MNELTKTLIFAGIAAVVAIAAFALRPKSFEPVQQKSGDRLFAEELKDATAADALHIARFDPDQSKAVELTVRRDGEQWVLASHNDYPADATDAKDRIQNVALKLIDLEVIDVASELTGDHGLYGVVSPVGDAVKEADAEDIGMLVGLQDAGGKKLAELIVGKEVRDDQSGQAKRFVRKANEPTVYTAAISSDDLKSDFADWIASDLLNINSGDIRRVTIKDYNVHLAQVQGPDGRPREAVLYEPRFELSTNWDNKDSQWVFSDMVERRGNRLAPSELTEDEELNGEKLDALKRAVDNLKIVNVEAKPKEIVGGVKSDDDLINDPAVGPLLAEKGFYPMRGELLSSDGEVRVQTEEGIEYILRFGREAGVERDEDSDGSKLTRYLLVSAKVAEEQMVAEEMEDPSTPPNVDFPGPPLGAGGQTGEEGNAGGGAEEDSGEGEAEADSGEAASGDETDASADDEGSDESGEGENADGSDTTTTDDETPMPPDPVPPTGEESTGPPAEEDPLVKKRAAAEAKVAELNQRFANWYYVVSEDEYKQIRLGRFDVIQEKEDSSFGLDELKDLDELPPAPGEDDM